MFTDRKRKNENKRLITILNQNGNVMEAEISEAPGNIEIQGTPVTAAILNDFEQKVEAAKDITERVNNIEKKSIFTKVSYDQTTDTFIF